MFYDFNLILNFPKEKRRITQNEIPTAFIIDLDDFEDIKALVNLIDPRCHVKYTELGNLRLKCPSSERRPPIIVCIKNQGLINKMHEYAKTLIQEMWSRIKIFIFHDNDTFNTLVYGIPGNNTKKRKEDNQFMLF